MDHPCHKCGHSVEDGKPFCSQCGAPQIRVAMPEASPRVAPGGSAAAMPSAGFAHGPADLPGISEHSHAFQRDRVVEQRVRVCAIAASSRSWSMSLRSDVRLWRCSPLDFWRRFFITAAIRTGVRAGSGAQLGALSGLLFSAIIRPCLQPGLAVCKAGGQRSPRDARRAPAACRPLHDPQVQAAPRTLVKPRRLASQMMVGFGISACGSSLPLGALPERSRALPGPEEPP